MISCLVIEEDLERTRVRLKLEEPTFEDFPPDAEIRSIFQELHPGCTLEIGSRNNRSLSLALPRSVSPRHRAIFIFRIERRVLYAEAAK